MEKHRIVLGDCAGVLASLKLPDSAVFVSDPPFNVGYHYDTYRDRKPEKEYYSWLKDIFGKRPHVIVHYPESLHRYSIELGKAPDKVVSWVYNANTPRQHRDIAFYGVMPNFSRVGQPYKNPKDKRIAERIKAGKRARLYDWWEVQQIKNVSSVKTEHPAQMPVEVMKNIIGCLPEGCLVVDPFCGSGTTGEAAMILGHQFIGIEMDPKYAEISADRLFLEVETL